MSPPLSSGSQQSPLLPQQQRQHQQQHQHQHQQYAESARSLSSHRPIIPDLLSVSSAVSPASASASANNDLSNPPSASSATTSFQIDWPSDGGPSSASSAHRRPDD